MQLHERVLKLPFVKIKLFHAAAHNSAWGTSWETSNIWSMTMKVFETATSLVLVIATQALAFGTILVI